MEMSDLYILVLNVLYILMILMITVSLFLLAVRTGGLQVYSVGLLDGLLDEKAQVNCLWINILSGYYICAKKKYVGFTHKNISCLSTVCFLI